MKTVFLDIMVIGRFYRQLRYTFCPLCPIQLNEVYDFIIEHLPWLKGKKWNFDFSEQGL